MNIKTARPSKNLDHKCFGTFKVLEVVIPYACHFELPPSMKIHPVFQFSLLSPASTNPVPGQVIPPPPTVEIEGHGEWDFEEVLNCRTYYWKSQYLVKWLDWDSPTWQPAYDLENAPADIQQFQHLHPTCPEP